MYYYHCCEFLVEVTEDLKLRINSWGGRQELAIVGNKNY